MSCGWALGCGSEEALGYRGMARVVWCGGGVSARGVSRRTRESNCQMEMFLECVYTSELTLRLSEAIVDSVMAALSSFFGVAINKGSSSCRKAIDSVA